jgi:hypothetical protein
MERLLFIGAMIIGGLISFLIVSNLSDGDDFKL